MTRRLPATRFPIRRLAFQELAFQGRAFQGRTFRAGAIDAHAHVQLAEEYDRLADLLRQLGIREVASYEKHRRKMIPLEI